MRVVNHFISLSNEFNNFNNTRAHILDSINIIYGIKITLNLCFICIKLKSSPFKCDIVTGVTI